TQSNRVDSVQAIMELINQEPFLSQKQMAEKLCLNQNTLKYYIKKMREKGIIERVGSSRKGKWIVK
ncbi:MAG: winged helix-turn-helix domain-containing protein, partial [Lachnospiraceae bacterium]|nr:winged helix-turn-helix domain-containing protein [Lachnospiraceae bacterium]